MPNSFDKQLRRKLLQLPGGTKGRDLASAYEQARSRLISEVYDYIRKKEPDLTDHGASHVTNIQSNVSKLLSHDGNIECLSGTEMYCLGMSILFHDAALVHGRSGHHEGAVQMYDKFSIRKNPRERTIISQMTRAHTGLARDGTNDTLKEVELDGPLEGERIRTREIAAILRLADELEEGPHRTSKYMLDEGLIPKENQPFHDYAAITNVLIDRANFRIVLRYELHVGASSIDCTDWSAELEGQLRYAYDRIIKLNQERQYTRYYTRLLEPFRATEAKFNFHYADAVDDLDLAPLALTDIVVPGDHARSICEIDPAYAIDSIVDALSSRGVELK